MQGLIHIYQGDGKGKTTAGLGLALRCAGSGQKVLYTQFLKDDSSSELTVLEQISGITLVRSQESFGFSWQMTDETRARARAYYTDQFVRVCQMAVQGQYRLLVLDEVIAAYNLDFVDSQLVLDFLRTKPQELEVVLTGRDPAPELVELADYVSNIQKVKHPFDKGVAARLGIEQ